MKTLLFTFLILASMCACSTKHRPDKKTNVKSSGYSVPVDEESVKAAMKSWPAPSQVAAKSMLEKYGLPTFISKEMFIWYDTGPFSRTVVTNEKVDHSFPLPHSDVLQQTIPYRVPRDKLEDVSVLDGSLLVDRTKGELTAQSDKEEMNYLALNLADKIVRGEMSVNDARVEYTRLAHAFASGMTNKYLTGINFQIEGDTRDPDRQLIQAQEATDDVEKTMKKKN